jgi:hypothetical protein
MPTMFFKSKSNDPKVLPKCFGFDSSPARAIGQALSPGNYDESTYEATKVSEKNGTTVYDIRMAKWDGVLHHVGQITHTPSYQR